MWSLKEITIISRYLCITKLDCVEKQVTEVYVGIVWLSEHGISVKVHGNVR